MQVGKFARRNLGRCLWTAPTGSALTGGEAVAEPHGTVAAGRSRSMNAKVGAAASAGTDAAERSVLLLWMIFTGLSVFAAFLLWRYGLIRLMVHSDRTYI